MMKLAARLRARRAFRPASLDPLEARITLSTADLRIATYNITSSGGAPRSGLDTILQAIGNESVGGLSRPLDVLLIQEVQSQATTSQVVANQLNAIYGSGTYAAGTLNGGSTGSGTQGLVYNTHSVQLVTEAAIGTASTSGQPRQALRYKLHPIGFSSAADFYVYDSHTKASDDADSRNRRLVEAQAIRVDSDALGQGAQVLYVGDYNTYSSSEPGYQAMLAAGNGQAFDPLNRPGSWHNTSSFVSIMTQAPANSPPSGLTGGGLDDRFDFQLFTGEMTDGQAMEYIPGSYHTFGNNGSVPLNGDINSPSNTALAGLANRTTVLNLLTTVSDHLPVVADYVVSDSTPTVQFTTASQSASEAAGTMAITAQLSAASSQNVVIPFTVGGTATPNADYTITASPITIPAGSTTGTITINVVNDSATEPSETVIVTMGTPTNAAAGATTVHTATILDDDSASLQATAVTATPSGMQLTFNRAIDTSTLNLITTQAGTLGPADLTLVGDNNGDIPGTLVVAPSNTSATFIATGGILPADNYTLTLRSGSDAFRDTLGNALDGNADGSAGGDLVRTFTVTTPSAGTVILSIPDFARGAGQDVNIPASVTTGIPLRLSNGAGVTSLDLFIGYDPTLITFTGAALAPGIPGTLSFNASSSPGRAHITYTSATALPAGATTLLNLQATIPANAPYRSKEVLHLDSPVLNGGAIGAIADDAAHVAAFLGDVTGNGQVTAFDATFVERISVGLDGGFSAFKLADPALLGDVTGNGQVSALDSTQIRRFAVGLSAPQIPPTPAPPPSTGGPDPRLSIGRGFSLAAGQTIQVPIDLEQTDASAIDLASIDALLALDTSRFDVIGVAAGTLDAGWGLDWNLDAATGTLAISAATARSIALTPGQRGTVAVVTLSAKAGAAPGSSSLNLLADRPLSTHLARTSLDEGRLRLVPAPTNGATDAVDGSITVLAPTRPGNVPPPASTAARTVSAPPASLAPTVGAPPALAPPADLVRDVHLAQQSTTPQTPHHAGHAAVKHRAAVRQAALHHESTVHAARPPRGHRTGRTSRS